MMPDSTTVLNWVQTVGVLAALGATANQIRARRKEQVKESDRSEAVGQAKIVNSLFAA